MARLGLDVRLEIRGAAEQSAKGLVEDARVVADIEGKIELARDGEGGALEVGCVVVEKAGGHRHRLVDRERLFDGFDEGGRAAVVGARFEEDLNGAEDVGGGEIAAVEGGEGAGLLEACNPRCEGFEQDLDVGPVEPVAGEDRGVGDGRLTRYQCVRDKGAIGVTDENEVSRFADGSVCALAH